MPKKRLGDVESFRPKHNQNFETRFRTWLQEFIAEKEYSNRDVAVLFGINDSLVGHYLSGTRLPTYTTLQRIKIAIGIDMNLLFDKEYDDDSYIYDEEENPFEI